MLLLLLLLLLLFVKTKDVCLLRLDDINVAEFFSGLIWERTVNMTSTYSLRGNKKRLLQLFGYQRECDIFNIDNYTIKLKFGRNPKKILEFLKVFNIQEMGYFIELLELLQGALFDVPEGKNGSISISKLWKYYFDINWYPDKYKNIRKQLPSVGLVTSNDTSFTDKRWGGWTDFVSHFLGGDRTIDLGTKPTFIEDESVSRMNIFTILGKRTFDLRKDFQAHPVDLHKEHVEVTYFDDLSESFGNTFGFYNKDEEGRIAYNYFNSLVMPFVGKVFTNKTFNQELGKLMREAIDTFAYQEVRLVSLLKHVYNGVTDHNRWQNLKNVFYDAVYSRQTKYNFIMIHNMFKSQYFRSLEFRKDFFMTNRGFYKIQECLNLMRYTYSNFHPNKKSRFITHDNIYDYVRYPKEKTKTRRFLYVPYYEGNKYYNLPEYPGEDEEWILSIFDVFDPRYWAISSSWFTGFHPDDKRKIRPLGLAFGLIPSDFFSLLSWQWRWLLRSNITREILFFLDDTYEMPNDEACLPAFPYLPDPDYLCAYPTWEFAPPIFPPENYTDLFRIEFFAGFIPYLPFCLPYRNPFTTIVNIIQAILTTILGPILGNNPAIGWINNFLEFHIGMGFINNATGLEGSDALPVGLWQCVLPQVPFLLIVSFIAISIFSVWFFSCLNYLRDTIVASEGMAQRNDIDDLKHALFENEEIKKLIGYLTIYNTERIKELEKK